jgi:hypothetical protein
MRDSIVLDDTLRGVDPSATRKHYSLPSGPSPTVEQWDHSQAGMYLNTESMAAVRRMCRLLDVFNVLDRSHCGSIKAHDISVGMPGAFGVEVSGADAAALIQFLNKTARGERASLLQFVRGFQFHERISSVEMPLAMQLATFNAGQIIFSEGEPASGVFILQSGVVLIEQNGCVVHRFSKAGEYFGDFVGSGNRCAYTGRSGVGDATMCVHVTTEIDYSAEPLIARPNIGKQVSATPFQQLRTVSTYQFKRAGMGVLHRQGKSDSSHGLGVPSGQRWPSILTHCCARCRSSNRCRCP